MLRHFLLGLCCVDERLLGRPELTEVSIPAVPWVALLIMSVNHNSKVANLSPLGIWPCFDLPADRDIGLGAQSESQVSDWNTSVAPGLILWIKHKSDLDCLESVEISQESDQHGRHLVPFVLHPDFFLFRLLLLFRLLCLDVALRLVVGWLLWGLVCRLHVYIVGGLFAPLSFQSFS